MTDYTPDFETFWTAMPKRHRPDEKRGAFRKWQTLVKRGVDPELLIGCARAYHDAMRKDGKIGTEYVKMAKTFLGPDAPYESYVTQPLTAAPLLKPPLNKPEEPLEMVNPEEGKRFVRELLQGLGIKGIPGTQPYVRAR